MADSLTIDQLAEQFFVSKYHLIQPKDRHERLSLPDAAAAPRSV